MASKAKTGDRVVLTGLRNIAGYSSTLYLESCHMELN
ncbi:hypothetical protein FOTG_11217 [Fusarium oxysporum f. sp. vasinfectum 25433]|uniref:Uncharacterized protein n=1 Tax=Fusarium oxysporum f. sp. vasinfectum 25433 TaxID=1089449 RepID=X0LIK7_FUSOX|nr:hypothetical protein FOTG_11217 [Fusarium oxysporum f. sp. vasinfectum 25433]